MKRKYIFLICIISLLVVVALLIGLLYLSVISGAIFFLSPNPPNPEITYGEFPISVTCEVNGEIKKIEDTVICEFDGINTLGSGGKRRKWKSYLKSGNERITLLKIDEISELYCSYGIPEYYMGDLSFQTREEYERVRSLDISSLFIIFGKLEDNEWKSNFISGNEALEKYKLKVIDVQYSTPIQNSFK